MGKKSKSSWNSMKMKYNLPESVGHRKGRATGKNLAVSAYIKKTETSQINNLMIYLILLEKQEQTKPKTSRWRQKIKNRAKINEIKTKQSIQTINETKSWFFEKINKIDKP
jgi:hypothetical protein